MAPAFVTMQRFPSKWNRHAATELIVVLQLPFRFAEGTALSCRKGRMPEKHPSRLVLATGGEPVFSACNLQKPELSPHVREFSGREPEQTNALPFAAKGRKVDAVGGRQTTRARNHERRCAFESSLTDGDG
jgi:hypothetical protein